MPEDNDSPDAAATDPWAVFGFFNEIGIIQQLSRALFEARLPEGMQVQHFSILNHLVRVSDGRTPLELARAFQTPKASLTHTLGGLEKHGLVEMRPNPNDGRSKQVWLTEAGRTFRDRAIAAMADDMQALQGKLDFKEIAELTPRLAQVRQVLDENRTLPDSRKPAQRLSRMSTPIAKI